MTKTQSSTHGPLVAVFGAAGHTGRFVVAELLRRGITPIAVARDVASLETISWPLQNVLRREASAHEPETLDLAFQGAQAVINCAGPFLETADAIAKAALRSQGPLPRRFRRATKCKGLARYVRRRCTRGRRRRHSFHELLRRLRRFVSHSRIGRLARSRHNRCYDRPR